MTDADDRRPQHPYHPTAWIIGDPKIGPSCWIGAFTVIDGSGGLTIGEGCEISCGAHIYTHSTVRRALSGRRLEIERAATSLGDRVHVGANAVILMGAQIGNECVIGAGAVVPQFSQVPDGSLVVGVPGRIIEGGARRYLESSPDA